MASLLSKLGRMLRLSRPKPPRVPRLGKVVGHRGIAAGNLKQPNLSEANVAKWQTLDGDQIEGFVYDAQPLFVHSSNVAMMQYHKDAQKLLVEFLNGSAYLYSNVSEQEAIQAAKQPSKGGFVWDSLRVRGTKKGHKKPYVRIK
jgi:hypothetical protein